MEAYFDAKSLTAHNAAIKEAYNKAAANATGAAKASFQMLGYLSGKQPKTGIDFLAYDQVMSEIEALAKTDKSVAQTLKVLREDRDKARQLLVTRFTN